MEFKKNIFFHHYYYVSKFKTLRIFSEVKKISKKAEYDKFSIFYFFFFYFLKLFFFFFGNLFNQNLLLILVINVLLGFSSNIP